MPKFDSRGRQTYAIPAGVGICTYSPSSGRIKVGPITAITVMYGAPIVSVSTARKRTLEVLDSGCLSVFDPQTWELVSREVEQCHDCLVPFVRQEPISCTEFNREIGWFYGALVGDGWLQPTMIGYAKNNPVKRAEFVRIARKHFDRRFSINEYHDDGSSDDKFSESTKLHLFGRPLREAVYDCYCARGEGRGALYKKIPDAVLACGSREFLLGVLAGSLEADKTLGWNLTNDHPRAVCKCNTSSWCQVMSLQRLGRLLGIRTSVTTTRRRGRINESYTVCWSVVDLVPIIPGLRFVSQEARRWQAAFIKNPPTRDIIDIVPITRRLAERLGQQVRRKGYAALYGECRKAVQRNSLTRQMARRVLALTEKHKDEDRLDFLKIVDNEAVHWDRIQNVLPAASEAVFGLALQGHGGFMLQNGLIVLGTSGTKFGTGSQTILQGAVQKLRMA